MKLNGQNVKKICSRSDPLLFFEIEQSETDKLNESRKFSSFFYKIIKFNERKMKLLK